MSNHGGEPDGTTFPAGGTMTGHFHPGDTTVDHLHPGDTTSNGTLATMTTDVHGAGWATDPNGKQDVATDTLALKPKPGVAGSSATLDSATLQLSALGLSDSPFEYIPPTKPNDFSPSWVCAICLEKIPMEETSQIKGCDHAYCVTCILKWATYKENPWCPQCKCPFSSLFVCKGIDGKRSDYMVEESVCLLLRAPWFTSLPEPAEEQDDYDEDYDEDYYYTSNVRLGNRRWGDSGYVRAGRREARPITTVREAAAAGGEAGASGSSGSAKGKGRRAKRAQKRQAINNGSVVHI